MEDIIARRKADASQTNLLSRMLTTKDPLTGTLLDEGSIVNECITFMVAGHETTSGLMGFMVHHLCTNPLVLAKARACVDAVLGAPPPACCTSRVTLEHLSKMEYIEWVLFETLRMTPSIPAIVLIPKKPTLLAGKYLVTPEMAMVYLTQFVHRDPEVRLVVGLR